MWSESSGDEIEITDPVVVVEVLAPTTRHIDASAKLVGYFWLPSVHHYLIFAPKDRLTIHHQRAAGGKIATAIVPDGWIVLAPSGIEVEVAALLA